MGDWITRLALGLMVLMAIFELALILGVVRP
jgi:hypothetical protein